LLEPRILKGKKSEDLSIYFTKKGITIGSENDMPVLEIINLCCNAFEYKSVTATGLE
jgi:hypothetical protein